MATKTRKRKTQKKAVAPKVRTRTITKIKYRTRKVAAKTARRIKRRASAVATSVARRVRRRVSGVSANRKDLAIQTAFVGGGFLAGMAVSNLAPLPAMIQNFKYKGLIFVALGVLGAAKLKSSRARSACVGLAAYGVVSTAKAVVPQLATLGFADAQSARLIGTSNRASLIGGNPEVSAPTMRVLRTPAY